MACRSMSVKKLFFLLHIESELLQFVRFPKIAACSNLIGLSKNGRGQFSLRVISVKQIIVEIPLEILQKFQ